MKRGFSIVELLVVVGIAAGLIALSLMLLSTSVKKSREVKCLATLRNLGMLTRMYSVSNSDWVLRRMGHGHGRAEDPPYEGELEGAWIRMCVPAKIQTEGAAVLLKWAHETRIMQCAGDLDPALPFGYRMNDVMFHRTDTENIHVTGPVRHSAIKKPSEVIQLVESRRNFRPSFWVDTGLAVDLYYVSSWQLDIDDERNIPNKRNLELIGEFGWGSSRTIDFNRHGPGRSNVLHFDGSAMSENVRRLPWQRFDDGVNDSARLFFGYQPPPF